MADASSDNSLTITGAFSPAEATNLSKYNFRIVAGGIGSGTVTYKWKRFGTSTYSSTVAIHSSAVSFEAGLLASWDTAAIYTTDDDWLIQVRPNETFKARTLGWLEDGLKRDLLGYDASSGDMNIVKDFYGAKELPIVTGRLASLPTDITIIPNNKEVHIGCGPSVNPKWLGRNQYSSFGGTGSATEVTLLEGAIKSSASNTGFITTAWVAPNGDIYGAEEDGTQLLKMTNSSGSYSEPAVVGDFEFTGIRKIAGTHKFIASQDDKGYVFILDSGADEGIIKRYDITNDTLTTITQTGVSLSDDLIITDMIVIGQGNNEEQPTSWNIWCSAYKDIASGSNISPTGILWHATTSNIETLSSLTFTNRDPLDKSGASADGFGKKYRQQFYNLVGGSCVLQSWGSWIFSGSTTNYYTSLYKRALTYHWDDEYVGILCRFRDISTAVNSHQDGANTWNSESQNWNCYAVNVEEWNHIWIEGTGGERVMRNYGTLNWIGVKNTHVSNTPTNLHHVALDDKVSFNSQTWSGPTGIALHKGNKDLYMSSDHANPFSNGTKWIHIPIAAGTSVNTDFMVESGNSFTPATANQTGSHAIVCDLDWRNLISIGSAPNYYPTKGVVLSSGQNQKGFWVQGINTSTGLPLGSLYSLWDGTNIGMTVSNGQGNVSGQVWNNKKLFYRYSMTYDGYQESPLSEEVVEFADSGTYETLDVTFTIQVTSEINRRVSHINLYRANGANTSSEKPLGLYRLVESLTATKWANTSPSVVVIEDKSDKVTGSYESRSGISETMLNTTIRWGIGTVASGSLIVGDCGTDEFNDASTYLFKSRPGDYDKFNWALDYLRLPFRPVAIATFQGRVYCWSQDTMLRINPDQFYIEDEFEGFGCLNKRMVVVTEYGMFFGDTNNIYMHNGQAPSPIGTSILKFDSEDAPSGKGYWDMARAYGDRMVMCFDSKRNSVITFCSNNQNTDGLSEAFSYNITNTRWDIWGHTALQDATTGQDGYIYHTDNQTLTAGTRLIRYLGNTVQRRNWKWHSKRISAGYPSQEKIHKKIRVISDDSKSDINSNLDVDYRINGSKIALQLNESHADYEKVSSGQKKAQDIKIMLSTSNNKDLSVRAIGSIFRRRPTK